MKILYFLKKLFRFIIHITNTRKIISDIGAFDICANDVQAEKITLWFKKILDIVDVELKIEGTIREESYLIISNHSSCLDIVVLGSTFEHIEIPADLVARLEGKSSLGRIGLLIHSTAGYVDPGWKGHLTLELTNVANLPITLYYGMKIGQISFSQLTEAAEQLYGSAELGSKYQGQTEPTASRVYRDFNKL